MLKILKPIFLLLLLTIATLVISPNFVKWDRYKPMIINYFNKQTNYSLTVEGAVTASFFPVLKIMLANVTMVGSDNDSSMAMAAKKLEIIINPLDLINQQYNVKNINIIDGNIELNNFSQSSLAKTALNSLTLKNSQLSYLKNNNNMIKDFKVINFKLELNNSNANISFSKYFTDSTDIISLSAVIDQQNSKITNGKISSKTLKSTFDAVILPVDNDYQLTGKIAGEVSNFSKFANYLANHLNIPAPTSKETVSFTSDFIISPKITNFNNVVIDSTSIKAQGDILLNIKQKPIIDLSLVFSKLDIDNLYQDLSKNQLAINTQQARNKLINALANNNKSLDFSISKDFDLLASIEIANLSHHGVAVDKASISFALHEGLLDLYYANLAFDEKNTLTLSGAITTNSFRPIFNGEINLKTEDISSFSSLLGVDLLSNHDLLKTIPVVFSANIALTPKQIVFSDINTSIKNLPIAADLNVILDSQNPQIFLNISIDQLDLDTLDIIDFSKINDFDNYSTDLDSLIKNISWLRGFDQDFTLGFAFNKLYYQKNLLQDFSGNIILAKGVIKLENLTINNSNNSYNIDGALDIRSLTPNLKLALTGDNLTLEHISNYLVQDHKITLPRVDWFDGNIKLDLANVNLAGLKLQNLLASVSMENQLVQIDKLSVNVFDGNFNTQGMLTIANPGLALSFTFANITAQKLLNYFPYVNNISGYVSMSGSITAGGDTSDTKTWLNSTQAAVSIAAGNVNLGGFDLNGLVQNYAMNNDFSKVDLTADLFSYLSSGSTNISNASGNFTISRGIFEMLNLTFNNDLFSGAFAGNMDLRSGLANAYTTLAFVPTAATGQVNLEIKMDGNLNNQLNKTISKIATVNGRRK